MKFFLDNNLPPAIARALNELVGDEHEVVHLRAKFSADTTDVEWIQSLGNEGDWIMITRDDAIIRKPQEREALKQSGITAFFLAQGWKHLTRWELAWKIVRWWPNIQEQASLVAKGAIFIVPVKYSGKFKVP